MDLFQRRTIKTLYGIYELISWILPDEGDGEKLGIDIVNSKELELGETAMEKDEEKGINRI